MKVLSLFSGIGGLDLAAEWAGMEVVAFCEIDPYAVKVLERRWPNVPIFGDVATLGRDSLIERGIRPEEIDVITGGFPCQPFSVAGKRRGKEDERFLWGEFSRIIGEIRPSWVVAENVPGLLSTVSYKDQFPMDNSGNAEGEVGDLFTRTGRGVADQILEEIEALGYTVLPIVYSASAVGAPHKRERVFVVAHSASDRSTSRISGPDKREEGIARIPFHGCS